MTALLASLGLLPAALSHAIGSDTQRPFAIVIIGGLVSSTLLTMLLLPTLYELGRASGSAPGAHVRRAARASVGRGPWRRAPSAAAALALAATVPRRGAPRARGGALARLPRVGRGPRRAPAAARAGLGLTWIRPWPIALQRNRDVIAAKLDIEAAQLDGWRRAAVSEPERPSYAIGNIVLGQGNTRGRAGVAARALRSAGAVGGDQRDHRRVGQARRAHPRRRRGRRAAPLLVEDALREIVYAVRSAFADVAREQSRARAGPRGGARATTRRCACRSALPRRARSPRPSCARSSSRGSRYQNAVIDADAGVATSRASKLAALLGLAPDEQLPGRRWSRPDARGAAFDAGSSRPRRSSERPDCAPPSGARAVAEAQLDARPSARRTRTCRWARRTRTATSRSRATTRTRSRSTSRCRCRSSIATRRASGAPSSTCAAPTNDARACSSRCERRAAGGRARPARLRGQRALREGVERPRAHRPPRTRAACSARARRAAGRREVVQGGRGLAARAARGAAHVPRDARRLPAGPPGLLDKRRSTSPTP